MSQHGLLKRMMAKRCELCLPCRYARKHPETMVGKAIAYHGKYCPFWKAWQDVYGEKAAAEPGGQDVHSAAAEPKGEDVHGVAAESKA